jgi:molybdate transport system substrate-binding protein
MRLRIAALRALVLAFAGALLLAGPAAAAEVKVMISGGLTAAYNALVPEFERATGNKVVTAYGPSMGTTINAIPVRLERGEPADVLIMVGYALGDLVKQGKVVSNSRVDLVKSPIGIAVRSGATRPDISSADAVMFQRLGITQEMKGKARQIPAEPVAGVVARGDAEIGFQQISEMLPVAGVDIVGPLPSGLQKITVFSAGIATVSKEPEAGRALIRFLASPAASAAIVKSGMEPIPAKATN